MAACASKAEHMSAKSTMEGPNTLRGGDEAALIMGYVRYYTIAFSASFGQLAHKTGQERLCHVELLARAILHLKRK